MAEYSRQRAEFLIANPVCRVTGQRATQVHHSKGREGKWLLDQQFWVPVSDEGHHKIETEREWAARMGFLHLRTPSK
jgi:hypothetical protein